MTSAAARKLVVPGGSGFLGRIIAAWFAQRGWSVVILSRSAPPQRATIGDVRTIAWDGRTPGDWSQEINGADVVLNLAGRSVNCRYTRANRRAMMNSRVESTRVLGQVIAACENPPRVWLNSSTATIYRHSYDKDMDEATGVIGATREAKDAFSIEIATAWEREFDAARVPQTRKVALRTAMVLAPGDGGVAAVLTRLVRLGLGGRMGHGRQYVSWIHEVDFCRAIEWLIDSGENAPAGEPGAGGVNLNGPLSGAVNVASPNPLPNANMMRILRNNLGRRVGLPATRWMLEIGAFFLRTETELIIKSRRVVPGRLLSHGFVFQFPDFEVAARDVIARLTPNAAGTQ